MSFIKSKGFKYFKNLAIGVGAAIVLIGALFKIQSRPEADWMLPLGLYTEAAIFLMLGILGPDKDYYWERLYPGLDNYSSTPLPGGGGMIAGASQQPVIEMKSPLDGSKMEAQLGGMLDELKGMHKSMSALKALQEADFSQVGDQVKKMGDFYANLNTAMASINDSVDDAKRFKEQLGALNQNLGSLNNVYGGMLTAMSGAKK
jgi:hypothetical protein